MPSQDIDTSATFPQAGRERLVLVPPIATLGTGIPNSEQQLLAQLEPGKVFMLGDNPSLPRMPKAPRLLDFFTLRFTEITRRHLLQSAKLALEAGQEEKVVIACLLHDISNGALLRPDHGYWGAQLIAPYVSEEIAWAVRYHQALRYFADESVGYTYPEAYYRFFEAFTDLIGRHFREPKEGLGFDGSASAHMWRTMIWPNNFL